jgi:hypothetical protein
VNEALIAKVEVFEKVGWLAVCAAVAAAAMLVLLASGFPPSPVAPQLPTVFVSQRPRSPPLGCRAVVVSYHFTSLHAPVSLPPVIAPSMRHKGRQERFDALTLEDADYWPPDAAARFFPDLARMVTRLRAPFCACFDDACFAHCLMAGSVPVWFRPVTPVAPNNRSWVRALDYTTGRELAATLRFVFSRFADYVAWHDDAGLVAAAYAGRHDVCSYAQR